VLVGVSGTGKTTFRRRLVAAGLPADAVVSLDDLRRLSRAEDVARGRPPRPLQAYSAIAVRRVERRANALAAFAVGYVADATHLRRRDRRAHVAVAQDTGLTAYAILTPVVSLDELVERNLRRPVEEQVPIDVLARQLHRRSLITAECLGEEGFSLVLEL
jgi:predicted kinase